MIENEHIPQEDLALYALQALSEEESEAVQLHLDQCASCRGELARLLGNTAVIGLSVQQHPVPLGARQRLLNRIAADAMATKQRVKQDARGQVFDFPRSTWIPWATAAVFAIVAIALGVENSLLNKELRDESS